MSSLLSFGNLEPYAPAAAQQLSAVICLYKNRPDLLQQMIDGPGEIVDFRFQEDSWPPSWTLIRSGTDRYFLAIAGTTNTQQWIAHAAGTFGRFVSSPAGGYYEHGYWRDAWDRMKADVRAALPNDLSTVLLHISGHSYGGALAQIAAYEYAPLVNSIELMTFGQPRVWDDRYSRDALPVEWLIVSWQDAVARLPSGWEGPLANVWLAPLNFDLGGVRWTPRGKIVWLAPGGQYGDNWPVPDPLPEGVALGPVFEHLTPNYHGRLRARYDLGPPDPVYAEALNIGGIALGGPVRQRLLLTLPNEIVGPAGQPQPIPFFDGVPPQPSTTGAFFMPAPTPLTGGVPYDVVMIFNSKQNGWEEKYVFYVNSGATDPYGLILDWVTQYSAIRRPALSQYATMDAVRISDQTVKFDSLRRISPFAGMGPGLRLGAAGGPQDGWQATFSDVSNTYKANRPYGGWAAVDTGEEMRYGWAAGPQPSQTVPLTFFSQLKTLVVGPFSRAGKGSGQIAIRVLERTPNPANVKTWNAIQFGPLGEIQLRLTEVTALFGIGDKVYISHKRKRCMFGLTGAAIVTGITNPGTYTVVELDKRPCCATNSYSGLIGTVAKRGPLYVPVADVAVSRGSVRDRGRPIGATRGRRSAGCC